MAITPNLPLQSSGARGRLDAFAFRLTWMLVAVIAMPLLQVALTTAMRLTPMAVEASFVHQPAK